MEIPECCFLVHITAKCLNLNILHISTCINFGLSLSLEIIIHANEITQGLADTELSGFCQVQVCLECFQTGARTWFQIQLSKLALARVHI
jgi:hypothetical protein